MKFFSILFAAEDRFEAAIAMDERARWVRDPLSHPQLETMSERELADLPFQRGSPFLAEPSAGVCR